MILRPSRRAAHLAALAAMLAFAAPSSPYAQDAGASDDAPLLGAPETPEAPEAERPERSDLGPSACLAFAQNPQPPVRFARYAPGLEEGRVAVTYVGHATFAIETPGGVTLATDYAGWAGRVDPPMVVTMNGAHSSHFTRSPDPQIQHVLRGWREDGQAAGHDELIGDVRVRSVSTNIRDLYGAAPFRENGNSIFIFEVADLCIGHLGHLHHVPTPEQFGRIGFLDVVMAPVDGGFTLRQEEMIEVLANLRARVVIPMHYFTTNALERFVTSMSIGYEIDRRERPTVIFERGSLPDRPTVMVTPPATGGGYLIGP